MRQAPDYLEQAIQAAFEIACLKNDAEIAEYLLQALEALSKRQGCEETLDKFYLKLYIPLPKRH